MAVLYQMKLDQSIVDCGMSYVFRLDSGHFFLIDGGFFTPGEADRLYRFLCAQAEGKPVIDAWFFSHAHQDHIGVFLDMMETHRDDVIIRKLIYNFQPMALPQSSEGWRKVKNDLETVKRFYEVAEAYCREIPILTPRAGDRIRIGEIYIEVLYTHENLDVPSTFNDHSTVLRADTNGWSLLFLGDLFREGSRILMDVCPDRLRCDIVQVAHHGFAGATKALYEAVSAAYALWPGTREGIGANAYRDADDYLLNHAGIRRHFIAGDGAWKIAFPHKREGENTELTAEIIDYV